MVFLHFASFFFPFSSFALTSLLNHPCYMCLLYGNARRNVAKFQSSQQGLRRRHHHVTIFFARTLVCIVTFCSRCGGRSWFFATEVGDFPDWSHNWLKIISEGKPISSCLQCSVGSCDAVFWKLQ